MTVPGLGLLSLSGFDNPMWLVLLIAPAALLAVYLVANERRRQRMHRFAHPDAPDCLANPDTASVMTARPKPAQREKSSQASYQPTMCRRPVSTL